MFKVLFFSVAVGFCFNSFALTSDQEMAAAILDPDKATIFTNSAESSNRFSTNTIKDAGGNIKEYRGLKIPQTASTPVIRLRDSNDNFEINFGQEYSSNTVWGAPGMDMERLSRTGKSAVYTSCRASGCVSVTPEVCQKINSIIKDSEAEKLKECGYLLHKVASLYRSANLKQIAKDEISRFNLAMPNGTHINAQGGINQGVVAGDSDTASSLILTSDLVKNCKKLEKTKFTTLESPISQGTSSKPAGNNSSQIR